RGVVGAAGFEPATWSTQNSRATRLRYAPAASRAVSIHGSVLPSKPRHPVVRSFRERGRAEQESRSLTAAKGRMGNAVADSNAHLLGGATDHLEHGAHRTAGRDQRFRERHCIFGDTRDAPVPPNEDHIEGNIGVLHPEARGLLVTKIEQHALSFRQL